MNGAGAPSRDRRWNCRDSPVPWPGSGGEVAGREERLLQGRLVVGKSSQQNSCGGVGGGGIPLSHPERLPKKVFEPKDRQERAIRGNLGYTWKFGWVGVLGQGPLVWSAPYLLITDSSHGEFAEGWSRRGPHAKHLI